jgi:hypothetical protein
MFERRISGVVAVVVGLAALRALGVLIWIQRGHPFTIIVLVGFVAMFLVATGAFFYNMTHPRNRR